MRESEKDGGRLRSNVLFVLNSEGLRRFSTASLSHKVYNYYALDNGKYNFCCSLLHYENCA